MDNLHQVMHVARSLDHLPWGVAVSLHGILDLRWRRIVEIYGQLSSFSRRVLIAHW